MAKQKEDKRTKDLLTKAGTSRAAKFKESQKAKGLQQLNLWVNDSEAFAIKAWLEKSRVSGFPDA